MFLRPLPGIVHGKVLRGCNSLGKGVMTFSIIVPVVMAVKGGGKKRRYKVQ